MRCSFIKLGTMAAPVLLLTDGCRSVSGYIEQQQQQLCLSSSSSSRKASQLTALSVASSVRPIRTGLTAADTEVQVDLVWFGL